MPVGVGVPYEDQADLINGTYQRIKMGSLLQVAQDVQDYPMMRTLFDEEVLRIKSGRSIAKNIKRTKGGNAQHVAPFTKGRIGQSDNTVRQEVPWRRSQTSTIWDEYEDIMNSTPDEVFDLAVERDMDMDIDLCELIEETIWGKPEDSSDRVTPWGVQMYVVPNATKGFNGGNPAGFNDVAGIDRSVAANANTRNYTDTYSGFGFGDGDIIETMQEMADKTHFRAPWPSTRSRGYPEMPRRGYFAGYNVYHECRKLLRAQNDDLGSDLDPYAEGAVFRQNKINWVPQIDTVSFPVTDPVMQLDWNCFHPVVLAGTYFRRHPARPHPEMPNCLIVWKDIQWNMEGYDCRRMGIIYRV